METDLGPRDVETLKMGARTELLTSHHHHHKSYTHTSDFINSAIVIIDVFTLFTLFMNNLV